MANDGMGIAQMALLAGADDAGSTMMEENVVSASGTTKLSATEYELQLSITRAGFKPVRRNSDYVRLEHPMPWRALPLLLVNRRLKSLNCVEDNPYLCYDVSTTFVGFTSRIVFLAIE